ncbi:MAG: hypothetical protein H8D45_19500 [Bacteroidetes bacterium]|nr:hypothetical protein [Bacteroidota bacterium]MBL7083940.1 hypothetical protein [Candidatus Aminicenantes bacterium]
MKEKEMIKKAEVILKDVLYEIQNISISKTQISPKISPFFTPDLSLEIIFNNKRKTIIIETKSVGEPRYIRSTVQQIATNLNKIENAYGIIAAPYISERTGEICKEANIGYIDLSGNCFISFDTIYIKKENYKTIYSEKRELKSLFSKKTSRLLRVLLNNSEKTYTQLSLSKESNVSIGLTNRAVKKLYSLEYIDFDQNKKISLKNPTRLLDIWQENYSYKDNNVQGFYSSMRSEQFESRLINYMSPNKQDLYALTLFSGATLIEPFVRSNQTFFYFSGNYESLKNEVEIKPVSSGANIVVLDPYDDGVFYGTQNIQRRNVVSTIQLYLDLYNYKGRGREQAEYLRERAINF